MGNSNSQATQILTPQWTHSYPRPKPIGRMLSEPHVKVLPQHVPPLRLRSTDNGTILQNGGTISGRKQGSEIEEVRVSRPRSSSAHRPPRLEGLDKSRFGSEPDLRFKPNQKEIRDEAASKQRISRSRKKYKAPPAPPNGSGMDSSSPDLNQWDTRPGDCGTPGRRARLFKTRAETNKRGIVIAKRSESEETKPVTQQERPKSATRFDRDDNFQGDHNVSGGKRNLPLRRTVSHEVISRRLSTPEFQAELLQVAQKLRPKSSLQRQQSRERVSPIGEASSSPVLQSRPRVQNNLRREKSKERNFQFSEELRVKLQNKENNRITRENLSENKKVERDVPVKSFYFGMEQNNNNKNINDKNNRSDENCNNLVVNRNNEHRLVTIEKNRNLINLREDTEAAVDKFAASLHKVPPANVPNTSTNSCSSSFASDPDDEVDGGIMLQLRPTLPKKQLEIPRFSPTAAWRLLSSIDSVHQSTPSPGSTDGVVYVSEERIHLPISSSVQPVVRSSHDKSGDSGISGDASPGGCHETSSEIAITSPKNIHSSNSKSLLVAWTPQQDLEEESSSDGLESPMNSPKDTIPNVPGAKFSPRGQIFSTKEPSFLSLPRDEHLSVYVENDAKGRNGVVDSRLNSLKKFTTGLVATKTDAACLPPDSNWVLSRSVPSSLNNSHILTGLSLSNPSSPDHDEEVSPYYNPSKNSSHSYLATGGRMMYLPEYQCRLSPDNSTPRNIWSKSCENVSSNNESSQQHQHQHQHSNNSPDDQRMMMTCSDLTTPKKKNKRFTFQSTVRIIENRKLAERLSREAELKENQRLSELEAMRRVEEEFQKKRAREKANIRHQLRLFNLDENNFTSLPPLDWGDSRAEPDGAPSSSPTCQQVQTKLINGRKSADNGKVAQTTQILSEFRETTRDYRDYRHSRYGEHQEQVSEPNKRSVVEHPRVVYDMPKNTPVYVSAHQQTNGLNQVDNERRSVGVSTPRSSSSDNYRRDFAHGAVPIGGRSLASSDSELSQPQTRQTSREHAHLLHRSRSVSPRSERSSKCTSRSSSPPPPRSSSTSPTRVAIRRDSTDLSRTPSPHVVTINGLNINPYRDVDDGEDDSEERRLSEDHFNSKDMLAHHLNTSIQKFTLTSVQPFSKGERSFKPIIFNPHQSSNN